MSFERYKEAKDLGLEYDAISGLQMTVYGDVAAGVQGAVASIAVLNFPATVGRQTYVLPLDNLFGTLFRFKATSGGIVKLYGGYIRLRAIGVYFDGAHGEIWSSQEQGVGIG